MRYFLIVLIIISCGTMKPQEQVLYNGALIEKEALPHVKEFENQCEKKVEVEIVFADLPGTIIGICHWFLGPKNLRFITIDMNWWSYKDYYARESLIFHELGHCVLNRFHNNKEKDHRPESIMKSHIFDSFTYYENREEYVNELCPDKKQSKPFKYHESPYSFSLFVKEDPHWLYDNHEEIQVPFDKLYNYNWQNPIILELRSIR